MGTLSKVYGALFDREIYSYSPSTNTENNESSQGRRHLIMSAFVKIMLGFFLDISRVFQVYDENMQYNAI